jgi:hypothetical protein
VGQVGLVRGAEAGSEFRLFYRQEPDVNGEPQKQGCSGEQPGPFCDREAGEGDHQAGVQWVAYPRVRAGDHQGGLGASLGAAAAEEEEGAAERQEEAGCGDDDAGGAHL